MRVITFKDYDDIIHVLDAIASKENVSRSDLIRRAIRSLIRDYIEDEYKRRLSGRKLIIIR